jgi:hypothetical protein
VKNIFLAAFFFLTTSAMASETIKGKFSLQATDYEITVSYDLPHGQEASNKGVNYFSSYTGPESTEILPAFCNYHMSFPASYNIVIKKVSTQQTIYSKVGTEYFLGTADGGLYSENKCTWNMENWEANVAGRLRMTETSFKIGNVSYRYIIDTYSMISAKGLKDLSLIAKFSKPLKGSDGKKDGEVWIDTQPNPDGSYIRTWLPLLLQ